MPTTRHEELRAAVTAARRALADHPDAATSPALADLIAAAEPFANFAPAVLPPPPRANAGPQQPTGARSEEGDADAAGAGAVTDTVDDEAGDPVPRSQPAHPGSGDPLEVRAGTVRP
ncbi:hypothetical protein [Embleya scabrispora]|uniref:hypothetical protein n=1 Tax=Embleya scabrispora TaxID=159449 RepID=UPI00036592E5|nr:hypothetical protein [Embleya scabrispora]MYS86281.1 hypothetical protein [Streptomyces sp. SID5474]